MKVNIGSENPVKVNAVKKAFCKYFKEIKVKGIKTNSNVREQPLNLKEIILGAKNRAKKSFIDCKYSVGIESGLMSFPFNSGFVESTIAVIFDGKNYFYGSSPLFEYPEKAVELLIKGQDDVNTAFAKLFNKEKDMGKKGGAVGELTKGKITRTDFTELAVLMALIKIISKEFYE